MTSKTYIVAWDEVMPTSLDISAQLGQAELDYLVFDVSTDPTPKPNWVVADKVRYFGHFYNALINFVQTSHQVFIWNAGDVSGSSQASFTKKIESYMDKDSEIWMMAPSLINDPGEPTTIISKSNKYENFIFSIHINGIWVALRRELALFILYYYRWLLSHGYMDFYKMISGHCLDVVYASWTIYNNKKIYRDMSYIFTCGTKTSHDGSTANTDCSTIQNRFLEYISALGYNSGTVKTIYDNIYSRFSDLPNKEWPIKNAYPNLYKYYGEFVF